MAPVIRPRDLGDGSQGPDWTGMTVIIVFLSLSYYNVLELLCIIWGTFKRYAGLYFWSFLMATIGIALGSIGFCIRYFASPSLVYLSASISLPGWVLMVTGQSLVLWSRLHLVLRNKKRLRIILYIIIFNAVICHGTNIPLVYGFSSSHPERFARVYKVTERLEIVVFFLQEMMLSGLYIYETIKMLRAGGTVGSKRSGRRLLKNLILVNILVMILDTTLVCLEFANLYDYQITYKSFAYSVKLKLEFTVLNRLVELTSGGREMKTSGQNASSSGHNNSNNSAGLDTFSSIKSFSGGSYRAYVKGGCSDSLHRPTPSEAEIGNRVMMTTAITVHREKRSHDIDGRSRLSCEDSISGTSKEPSDGNEEKSSSQINLARNSDF